MKKIIGIGFFLVLFAVPGFAQMGGINFTVAVPQGEFAENADRNGYGLSVEALWQPHSKAPYGIGANVTWMNFGTEDRVAPLSYTIPDITVDITRMNNMAQFQLLFKITPSLGFFRPYIDLIAGGSYLYTETKLESRHDYDWDDVVSDVNIDDWAWNYGVGGGLMFEVHRDPTTRVLIDIKARYLWGTEADYLTEGSVAVNPANGSVTYYVSQSKTDMVTAQIGVFAFFNVIN